MTFAELAKLLDAGGTVILAAAVLTILLRLERFTRMLTSGMSILVDRTRGMRVKPGTRRRGIKLTLEPIDEDDQSAEPEAVPSDFTGRYEK